MWYRKGEFLYSAVSSPQDCSKPFTLYSLTDLFNQTPSQLLCETSSHMLQLMREGCSYTYPPLSIVTYSFIQLSELEQCRVKKPAKRFNTAAQDSNSGSRSRKCEALSLSHCALREASFWNHILQHSIRTWTCLCCSLYLTIIILYPILYECLCYKGRRAFIANAL